MAVVPGVYSMRVLANGATLRAKPFTREQLLTGAVWKGGDNLPPTSGTDPRTRDEQFCHLLECLFGSDALGEFLAEQRINPEALQKCLYRFCHERTVRALEGPGARDEAADDRVRPVRPKGRKTKE